MIAERIIVKRNVASIDAVTFALGHAFHVTTLTSYRAMQAGGVVSALPPTEHASPFSHYPNAYFRTRGCVSVFDLRTVAPQDLREALDACSPMMAAWYEPAVFLFLSNMQCTKLISAASVSEDARGFMLVPWIESGYPGDIDIASCQRVCIVERV